MTKKSPDEQMSILKGLVKEIVTEELEKIKTKDPEKLESGFFDNYFGNEEDDPEECIGDHD